MSDLTRRETLQTLAAGAAVVLVPHGAAAVDVPELAVDRMSKGHS